MSTATIADPVSDQDFLDPWPILDDGTEWDGMGLLDLLQANQSPFGKSLDVRALLLEIQASINVEITNVPIVTYGANHFGFYVETSTNQQLVARVSRGDVNREGLGARERNRELRHDHFELAAYKALRNVGPIFNSGPLYHRDPVQHVAGTDITPNQGRRLFLFAKASGEMYHYGRWRALNEEQKAWERIFGQSALPCPVAVRPERSFCIALLLAKVDAVLGGQLHTSEIAEVNLQAAQSREGIGQALRRLIPRILPNSCSRRVEAMLYRFVLDHGDFGMHNMTVALGKDSMPQITSVYDWEGGSVVPAILSEPKMVTTVDLVIDEDGDASISRWGDGDTPDKMSQYRTWTDEYYKCLFSEVPEYQQVIKTCLDARRIWFTLQKLRGAHADRHLAELGVWAEKRHAQLDQEMLE